MATEFRKGIVPEPKPDVYLYRQLFRQNLQKEFAGEEAKMSDLTEERVGKVHAATAAQLGYTIEEAENKSMLEEAFNDLQWAKPRKGEDEIGCCSPESVM